MTDACMPTSMRHGRFSSRRVHGGRKACSLECALQSMQTTCIQPTPAGSLEATKLQLGLTDLGVRRPLSDAWCPRARQLGHDGESTASMCSSRCKLRHSHRGRADQAPGQRHRSRPCPWIPARPHERTVRAVSQRRWRDQRKTHHAIPRVSLYAWALLPGPQPRGGGARDPPVAQASIRGPSHPRRATTTGARRGEAERGGGVVIRGRGEGGCSWRCGHGIRRGGAKKKRKRGQNHAQLIPPS